MPNNNPNGKGGFADRPEDINRGGRTKKYLTLLLEQIGEEIEPKSGKQFKELIARRTWIDALNGNPQARKEIFDRIEGLPKQSVDVTTDGKPLIQIGYGHQRTDKSATETKDGS